MAPKLSEDDVDDLLWAARTGDQEEVDGFLQAVCRKENISQIEVLQIARDEQSGNGVLHMAAANGHAAIITHLCRILSTPTPQNPTMLAVLNAQNNGGNTALHWAALNGHLDAVKVLLDQGADPTIHNQRGHDAVYEAELNDKTEVVEWVLKEGGEGLEAGVGGVAAEGEAEAEDAEIAGTSDTIQESMTHLDLKDADAKP